MSDAAFEFNAPENAEIDEGQAQTAGGQWVNTTPVPQKIKGRYAFVFPLRPGQTQFRVTYHLSYSGKATVDPNEIYPLQHFVIIMPRTLGFTPSQSGVYQDKQPPDLQDAIAEVASNTKAGQNLSFDVSGEGMLQDQNQNASNDTQAPPGATADNRPGGGLGKPGEDPDPLDQYRWRIRRGACGRRGLHYFAFEDSDSSRCVCGFDSCDSSRPWPFCYLTRCSQRRALST
jgi:hypothetical protein